MGRTLTMSGRWPALLLAGAVALAFADSSIVMLGLPEIYGDLDASIIQVSLVITGYNAVVAIVALALIPVVGRVRPGLLVGFGLVVFLVSSLACGLVNDLTPLIVLRSTQGLGAAFVLAASLPVMALLTGSPAAGRAWWGLAGTLGAVLGPAIGGVLTELFDWRAIFIAQAPVAALALLAVVTPAVRRLAPEGRSGTRIPFWSNLGLLFAFGALVGALFLAVLMIVTVWGFGPLYGALVVSVLPVAALLVRRLSGRVGAGWSAMGGSLLLAAGLVGLAFLPAVSAWWAAAALAVCGAGFGLLVPPLTAESVSGERGLGAAGAASVSARHIGLVLVLLIVAPLLATDLDAGEVRATANGTQVILDAPLDLQQKVPVALALSKEFDRTARGEVPDVTKPFDDIGAADDANVRAVRDHLLDTIQSALTRSFRSAYLVSALFALLTLIPVAAAWTRALPGRRAAPGAAPRGSGSAGRAGGRGGALRGRRGRRGRARPRALDDHRSLHHHHRSLAQRLRRDPPGRHPRRAGRRRVRSARHARGPRALVRRRVDGEGRLAVADRREGRAGGPGALDRRVGEARHAERRGGRPLPGGRRARADPGADPRGRRRQRPRRHRPRIPARPDPLAGPTSSCVACGA